MTLPKLPRNRFKEHKHFQTYDQHTNQDGVLDAKTKELMHLALVLAYHCEP